MLQVGDNLTVSNISEGHNDNEGNKYYLEMRSRQA